MHSTVVRAISVRPAARIAAARAPKPSARPPARPQFSRGARNNNDVFLQKGTHRSRLVASRAEKQSDGAGEADAEKPKKASEDVAKDEDDEMKAEAGAGDAERPDDVVGDVEKAPALDDDVAPALEGDWRDFRAMLISQEKGKDELLDEDEIAAASGPNLELLRQQNPKLAKDKPWAHRIGAPEKGCLLLAAADEFTLGQQYFHQAVILLLEHHDKGSMGVILNRPTQYNMGYVSGQSDGPFAENALYFGGDVGDGTVSFLHGSDKVQGSAEVLPGVYLGGYDSACELVKKEEVDANEFKFFARYCGWAPGQLKSECERGVWYPVACSKQLALKQVIQLPKPLWREILELCGGELKSAAAKAYGEEDDAN